jgi:hypothetical protein
VPESIHVRSWGPDLVAADWAAKRHPSRFCDAISKAEPDSLVHFAVEFTIQRNVIPKSAAQCGHMLQVLPTLLRPPLVAGLVLGSN